MRTTIRLGQKLFEFSSYRNWIAKANTKFRDNGTRESQTVCIDQAGRICRLHEHFDRAEREGMFPIKVYDINTEAY